MIDKSNCIELHYFLESDKHEMDAFAINKCALHSLNIISAIANYLHVQIEITTFPRAEGGIIEWLKIVKKQEDKSAPITTEFIKYLAISVLTVSGYLGAKIIDYITSDSELKDLQKEALKTYIREHQVDLSPIDDKVRKLRSNYYATLSETPNVEKIEISSYNETDDIVNKRIIDRSSFSAFLLLDDKLDPIEIENAIILITAPVISKGKYNTWHGKYGDTYIDFKMCSNEFKTMVQSGDVTFKNGFSINCLLRVHRKLNDTGEIIITKYEVIRVNSYFIADKIYETKEGKKHKLKLEQDNAPNLFTGLDGF